MRSRLEGHDSINEEDEHEETLLEKEDIQGHSPSDERETSRVSMGFEDCSSNERQGMFY